MAFLGVATRSMECTDQISLPVTDVRKTRGKDLEKNPYRPPPTHWAGGVGKMDMLQQL